MNSTKPRDLKPLTSLRFFAAMFVVVFHQSLSWLKPATDSLPPEGYNIVHTGYVSVGFFFILSGFILTHVHLNRECDGGLDKREFWLSRFARIYPMCLLGFILAAPFVLKATFEANTPFKAVVRAGGSAAAALTLSQSWFPKLALRWNGPAWSLSTEAFFYLLFPFLGYCALKLKRPRAIVGFLAATWLAGLAIPILFYMFPIGGFGRGAASLEPPDVLWVNVVKFNPLLRLPDFLFGIGLCRLFQCANGVEWPNRIGRVALPVALFTIPLVLAMSNIIPYPILHNGLLTPLFGIVIYQLAVGEGLLAKLLSSPLLVLMGQISFAIYILHVPLYEWAKRVFQAFNITTPIVCFILYVTAVIALSYLAFALVEEPCRKYLKRFSLRRTVSKHTEPLSVEAFPLIQPTPE